MIAPSVPSRRSAPPLTLVGTTLGGGRYAVLDALGCGGMGEVYKARDQRLHRDVAIKRMSPALRGDPVARARFLREVRRTSRLDDPHLAVVHDVLEEKDDVFLVLELVPGKTLRQRAAEGPLALEPFLSIAIQAARALQAAHAQGVIHCDLKPENVMITPSGNVKVLDFGLALALPAKGAPEDPTRTGTAPSPPGENAGAGTMPYMAPEALRDEPCDERSDLFALGVVLYEAWTGLHPFRGANVFVTSDRILHATPLPASHARPETPRELAGLFTRLLVKERTDRPQSASEVLAALREIARGRPGVLDPLPVAPMRRAGVAPGALVLSFALAVLVLVLGTQPRLRHGIATALGLERPLPARKLLAILPFETVGNDAAIRALGAGLRYTVASRLTGMSAGLFQVIPVSEIERANAHSPAEARKGLGATLVVTGSVQRVDDEVRVTFDVVDPVALVQLRSATVTSPAAAGVVLQDQVAQRMVEELEVELGPRQREVLRPGHAPRGAANALVLEGRGRLLDYQDPASVAAAVALFRRAIAQDEEHAPAWAGLGGAAWATYQLSHQAAWVDTARFALERAARLDPGLAEAYVGLGDLDLGTGFPELAAAAYRKAIALDPANDTAYRGIAAASHALGRDADAEAAYREAITKHPDDWGGYSHLGVFYLRQARYAEAYAMLRRVTELAPLNARGWSNLGGALTLLDRPGEAIAALEEAARLRPSAVVESNLGSLLLYEGRMDAAGSHLRRAEELDPHDYRIQGRLADYLRLARKSDSARTHYELALRGAEAALEVNPRDAAALAALATYNANLGRRAEAERRIAQALAAAPDDPEIQFYAVMVYEELGARATALAHLRRAVDAGYSLVEVRRNPDLVELRKDPRTVSLLANRG
jgi:serine/threonine-protein kinase